MIPTLKQECFEISTENEIEHLIDQYLPKIKYYAYRFSYNLPPELSEDDLVSAGVIGLLEAIGRYDNKREASLKTFSDLRIKGAMIDEIRSMQWTSRDTRKKLNIIQETAKSFEKRHSRKPDEKEVAEELGISIQKLNQVLLMANMRNVHSLQDIVTGKNGETMEIGEYIPASKECDPHELLEIKQSKAKVSKAIEQLPERERRVIIMYYYEERTLKQIGAFMGLTESRMCQILNSGVGLLKAIIDQES